MSILVLIGTTSVGTASAPSPTVRLDIPGTPHQVVVETPAPYAEYTLPQGANVSYARAEPPPWQITGGVRQYFLTNGRKTWLCNDPASLIPPASGSQSSPVSFSNNCTQITETARIAFPDYHGPLTGNYDPFTGSNSVHPGDPYWPEWVWRRSYNGIYSAHVIPFPAGDHIVSYNHVENKNFESGSEPNPDYYQNSPRPSQLAVRGGCADPMGPLAVCSWSSILLSQNGFAEEHWSTYFGFLTEERIPFNAGTNWGASLFTSLGPVVWPSAGYIDLSSNPNCAGPGAGGLRHPTSIVHDGYVHLFYLDDNTIKTSRAAISSGLGPGTYWSFKRGPTGGGGFTEPALPVGYEPARIREFFGAPGPDASPLFLDSADAATFRFAVAEITDAPTSPLFIGVDWGTDNSTEAMGIALRLSTNLTDWGPRVTVWDDPVGQIQYPVFLDRAGTSNTQIQSGEFYLIGGEAADNGQVQVFGLRVLSWDFCALPCDDGDACTADSCDPVQGCLHEAATCNDGDPCTADSCDAVQGCLYQKDPGLPACVPTWLPAIMSVLDSTCGNGVVDSGEQCDDGNTTAGDCCSPVCQLESCDDGNPCTTDICQSETCVGLPAPEPGCREARRGILQLTNRSPDTRDRLAWKWLFGPTTSAEFGNPADDLTSYDLCIYDTTAATSTIAWHANIPAGGLCSGRPCWQAAGGSYRFVDKDGGLDGITRIILKAGTTDNAKILVKGKGPGLALPSLPLTQDPNVVVQLKSSEGECWSSPYAGPAVRSDAERFKDVYRAGE